MDIQLEFISANVMKGKTSNEKVNMIVNAVRKDGKIVVLEEGLTNDEQNLLIEKTMTHVSTNFPGIEIASFGGGSDNIQNKVIKLLGGKTVGLAVVGPSNIVKQIKRDPEKFKLLASTSKKK